jgi:hypothetical protein
MIHVSSHMIKIISFVIRMKFTVPYDSMYAITHVVDYLSWFNVHIVGSLVSCGSDVRPSHLYGEESYLTM